MYMNITKYSKYIVDRHIILLKILQIFGALGSVILIPILKLEMRSKSTYYRSLSLSQYPDSEALVSGENGTLVNAYKDVIKSQGGAVTQLETKVNIIDGLLIK